MLKPLKKSLILSTFIGLLSLKTVLAEGVFQNILVEGMTCSSCAKSVKSAFVKLPEVKSVEVNVEKGTVKLELQPQKSLTEQQIRDAVQAAGYKVKKISPDKSS